MKQVLMILDNDFRSDHRVQKEAETLLAHGYEVEILCVTTNLPAIEIRNGISISRMLHPDISTRPFSKMAVNSYHQAVQYILRKEVDVLHCHDYNVIHIGAAVKKKNPRIKLIYDAHEYFEAFNIHKTVSGKINKLKAFVVWKYLLHRENYSAKQVDALISTTDYISNVLSKKFGIADAIALRNIPEQTTIVPTNYIRQSLDIPDTAKIVVHSGNIYFGEEFLHEIVEQIKKVSFDIRVVFLISADRGSHIKEVVQKNKFGDRIHFMGYPTKEEIVSILSSADIGLSWVNPQFQSHYLTSANRYWEYTLAQLPVLSNKQLEIEEQVSLHRNGIIFGNFQCALEELLLDYVTYKKNAVAASTINLWEQEAEKLLSLYADLQD